MTRISNHRRTGFTLLEALVTVTLATLILLGLFQSSFTANKATVQTEQGMEAENLIASRFSEFLSQTSTYTLPFEEEEFIQTRTTNYTLVKKLKQAPTRPHCAIATATLTWQQGQVAQSKALECLIPLESPPLGSP